MPFCWGPSDGTLRAPSSALFGMVGWTGGAACCQPPTATKHKPVLRALQWTCDLRPGFSRPFIMFTCTPHFVETCPFRTQLHIFFWYSLPGKYLQHNDLRPRHGPALGNNFAACPKTGILLDEYRDRVRNNIICLKYACQKPSKTLSLSIYKCINYVLLGCCSQLQDNFCLPTLQALQAWHSTCQKTTRFGIWPSLLQ